MDSPSAWKWWYRSGASRVWSRPYALPIRLWVLPARCLSSRAGTKLPGPDVVSALQVERTPGERMHGRMGIQEDQSERGAAARRSEQNTSELQSRQQLVC